MNLLTARAGRWGACLLALLLMACSGQVELLSQTHLKEAIARTRIASSRETPLIS